MTSITTSKPALRLPYAIAGVLVAVLAVVAQIMMAAHALRTHSAQSALHFVVMVPLTLSWCFMLLITGPASVRKALQPFARVVPGLGMSMWLLSMFAVFVLNYGFR
jgi:hypothetical protein